MKHTSAVIITSLFSLAAIAFLVFLSTPRCIGNDCSVFSSTTNNCRSEPAFAFGEDGNITYCSWRTLTFVVGLMGTCLSVVFLMVFVLLTRGKSLSTQMKAIGGVTVVLLLLTTGLMHGDMIKGHDFFNDSSSSIAATSVKAISSQIAILTQLQATTTGIQLKAIQKQIEILQSSLNGITYVPGDYISEFYSANEILVSIVAVAVMYLVCVGFRLGRSSHVYNNLPEDHLNKNPKFTYQF